MKEAYEDTCCSPRVTAKATRLGILNVPHIKGNAHAQGSMRTRLVNGAVYCIDPVTRQVLSEQERLEKLLRQPCLTTSIGGR